eukprot:g3644.t1
MAAGVEPAKTLSTRRRWLAFLDCAAADDEPTEANRPLALNEDIESETKRQSSPSIRRAVGTITATPPALLSPVWIWPTSPKGACPAGSSPVCADGVPDWLQTTTTATAASATDRPPQNTGAQDQGAGGLDWLQSLAHPSATAAGGVPVPPNVESSPVPTREQPASGAPDKIGEEEVDWLGGALKGSIPSTSVQKTFGNESSPAIEDGPESSVVGDDWLAIAKSSGQAKRKSPPPSPRARPSVAASAATQGGWMSSGKLGLPMEDDSDEGVTGKTAGGNGSTAPAKPKKNKKQAGKSSPTAGGSAGWLSSGALGAPAEDESDEDDGGGGGGGGGSDEGRGVGVTIETQTEDDIQAVVDKGSIEKENAPKLPPWAKPWVPPPKPEVVPETPDVSATSGGRTEKEGNEMPDWLAAAAGASALKGTAKAVLEETELTTAEQVDAGNGDGDDGGLSWLTKAAENPALATAKPTEASSAAEPDLGSDWLSVAKCSGQIQSKPFAATPAASTAAPAAPGGWMSSGKLGISTEDDSDQDDAGKVGGPSATPAAKSKKKKKKKAAESASAAGVSGGWLGSGALGVPAEGESDEEDEEDDGGGSHGVGVTIETQTEDDIEAVIEGGVTENGNAPKLPPWAKPCVPPPKPEAVPDAVPEVTFAPTDETDKKEPEVPDWLAAAAGASSQKDPPASGDAQAGSVTTGQGHADEGSSGGLSWLTNVAQDTVPPTATPTGASSAAEAGSGNDWLAAAKSSGQAKLKPTQGAIGVRRASNGTAAPAGWMSSGKLGLPSGGDSDEDGGGGSGAAVPGKSKKSKQIREAAVSAASGPGGWLSSGALGAPTEDESDEDGDGDGGGHGRAVMVTMDTQTEDDIEAVTERGDAPKLPPWAKPWTPPPKPEVAPDDPPEESSEKEENNASATPDWIASSAGMPGAKAAGGSGKEAPASGGGLDWLTQVARPESDPVLAAAGEHAAEDTNTSDWLQQAVDAKSEPTKQRSATASCPVCQQRSNGGHKVATTSTLSWMSSMKRRSSMDLEDGDVQAAIAQAKAKTVPGGWLQIGALGAPDAVEEENELAEARAASSLASDATTRSVVAGRRPSLSGGAPRWAPTRKGAEDVQGDTSGATAAPRVGRRPSLSGGMPQWAATSSSIAASEVGRRPSLSGGMPRWAPAPTQETEVAASGRGDGQGADQKKGSEDDEKAGRSATSDVRVSDWLAAAAGAGSGEETSATAGDASDQGANEQVDASCGCGLGWLTKFATGKSTSSSTSAEPTAASAAPAVNGSSAEDDDWLAAAKSTSQDKRKSRNSPAARSSVAAASAAPGGWMSSGKLGLSTGDGSDEDNAGNTGGRSSKSRKRRQTRRASSSAGGPAGWLGSGTLGVPAVGGSDEDDGGGGGGSDEGHGVGVTIETQTEDDIEAVTKGGAVEKDNAPRLPPWAKPWVPPSKAEVVPDAATEVASAPTEEAGKKEPEMPDWLAAAAGVSSQKDPPASGDAQAGSVTTGQDHADEGSSGGLSWLTNVAQDTVPPTATSTGASSAAEAGAGNDWLAAAKSSGQAKLKPTQGAIGVRRASNGTAAPAGWMSSGKLGLPSGGDSDEDGGGGSGAAVAAVSRPRKKRPKRRPSSSVGGPAGWLSSGALGAPTEDESDEDDDGDGGGHGRAVMVTTDTQTEDDIEAVTERGDAPKLPPWAKPWTPPPKPEVVPDDPPEESSEKEETATPDAPDWILASVGANTGGGSAAAAPASGGGLDWLVQATDPESAVVLAASTGLQSAGCSAPDWLQQAGATVPKPRHHQASSSQRQVGGRRKVGMQSPLSWMSSMKRRSSMDLEDEDVQTAIAQAKAKTVPGGWLQIGALGAPDAVEEEKELAEARAASSLARRPSLAGGMPPWAPTDKSSAAVPNGSNQRKRRSSLDGGMPAWAPPRLSSQENGATPALRDGLASPPRSSSQKQETTPKLPDWLAAAAGGDSAPQGTSQMGGDRDGDGEGNDWLTQAALSRKGVKDAKVMDGDPLTAKEVSTASDPLTAKEVSTASSPGGNAVDRGKLAASADWLSAAVASSSKGSSKAGSAKAKDICGGAPVPGSWLTSAIASGKLGNPGNDDEICDVACDGANDATTQTDDVTITEATKVEETPKKPKSKLPPWAKPWTPPTPAAVADAEPTPSSSTDKNDHQAPSVDKDSANAGGPSSGGSGGLDWIGATVTGDEQRERSPSWLADAAAGKSDRSPTSNAEVVTAREESECGEDDWLAAAASERPRANTLPSSRPAQRSALESRPGGWMTAALASKGRNKEGGGAGMEREKSRGDGGRHVAVETASVGVQWEEEGGAVAGAPSSSTRGGLPPWAKPYARSISPPSGAVGDDGGDVTETGEQVAMESSGIQCGESVLGGRVSGSALGS